MKRFDTLSKIFYFEKVENGGLVFDWETRKKLEKLFGEQLPNFKKYNKLIKIMGASNYYTIYSNYITGDTTTIITPISYFKISIKSEGV